MDIISYQLTPESYGQVRYCPILLANHANTSLEEWFTNYKFLLFSIENTTEEEFSNHRLSVEYHYSLRLRERTFTEIKQDSASLIEASLFQDLFRILVTTLEQANELFEISETKKIGQNILDFKREIEQKTHKFNRDDFPTKIKKFAVEDKFQDYLATLVAINKARNCFEHRNGVLGVKDCNVGEKLVIKFRYPAPIGEDGKPVGLFDKVKGDQYLRLHFVEGKKTFRINERIRLDFEDSYKLIYTINFALKGIVDFLYKLKDMDVEVPIIKEFKS